jgi:hypothetical protein
MYLENVGTYLQEQKSQLLHKTMQVRLVFKSAFITRKWRTEEWEYICNIS